MRKFWLAVAVTLLVCAVTAPAPALDFKFSGSFRYRLYDTDGLASISTLAQPVGGGIAVASPLIKTNSSQRTQADLRFRPYIIVSDDNGNVQSHLRFEIGDVVFGDTSQGTVGRSTGGATAGDGVNVETKWAFIDVQLPGGIPMRLRGGIQPWLLPKSAILDDDISGIKLYGKSGMVAYEGGWMAINQRQNAGTQAVNNNAAAGPSNDDINAWYAKLDLAIAKAFNPYIYGVWKHGSIFSSLNNSSSSDGWWIGLGTTGTLVIAKYDFDFVYGADDPHLVTGVTAESRNLKQEGWWLDGGIEFPVGPAAIGVRGMYATGDKYTGGTTGTKNETFPGMMDSANSTCLGGYTVSNTNEMWWNSNGSIYFQGGPDECPGNSWTLGVYAIYRPVTALKLKVDYNYIGAASRSANIWTGKSQIGNEFSFVAEYIVATGTKMFAMAGIILTPSRGQTAAGATPDLKDIHALAVGVQHDF